MDIRCQWTFPYGNNIDVLSQIGYNITERYKFNIYIETYRENSTYVLKSVKYPQYRYEKVSNTLNKPKCKPTGLG